MVDARDIRWDRGSAEEVRRWLGDQEERDEAQPHSPLDYPWPISILSQKTEWGSSSESVVNVTLGFDSVPEAEDYEIRTTILKPTTPPDPTVPFSIAVNDTTPSWTMPVPQSGDVAFLTTWDQTLTVSGVYATWTKIFSGNPASTHSVSIWMGQGIGTGTTVTVTCPTFGGLLSGSTGNKCVAVFRGTGGSPEITAVASTPSDTAPGGLPFGAPTVPSNKGDIVLSCCEGMWGYLISLYPDSVNSQQGFNGTFINVHNSPAYAAGQGMNFGVSTGGTTGTVFNMYDTGSTGQAVNMVLKWY